MDLFNAVIESTKWPTGSERRNRLVMERRRIETTEHAVIHADFIKSLGQDTRNQHLEWGVTNRGRALGELYTNRVLASMELVQAAEQERFSLLARHHREIAMEDNIRQAAELLIRRDSMNRVVVAINELQQRTRQRFNAILAKKMPITTMDLPWTQVIHLIIIFIFITSNS
ncbi:hypothetical protein BDF22DRAFT_774692 [Syncephalis plumigaleata]|nr:hypothetical protein BDF22DRAFT_774692 [Syncephalis plumigaleata]